MSSDAGRMADITAAVDKDLTEAPVSRARMDLLWLDPSQLEALREALRQGLEVGFPPASEFEENRPLFDRLQRSFDNGELGVADLDWALEVDAIALDAHLLSNERPLVAIKTYREALRSAPGCDLYLMSMGVLFAQLGLPEAGLRYLQRSAELNPTNQRILRNLAAVRSYL